MHFPVWRRLMADVSISAEQVYAELRKIGENVIKLVVKVDSLATQGSDHEKRINALERKMAVVYALASTLGILFGTIAGILTDVIIK